MARAGAMRDRITLERETGGALDGYGNPTGLAWDVLAEVWGDLREAPGREVIAAGRVEGQALATLRLRTSKTIRGLTSADRVRARGHIWAITAPPIQATPKGDVLEVTLERGGAVN
ncbi:head-tail adaptor protein [Sulfitobacter sp. 1A16787]|uniref:head-tail adaptor protein n=1 Tax=Sulfitobacter sp. 1A16787 TaxID=3368571 RepID=UPI0037450E1D